MTARPIGVGVIGLGFMGRQHIASYRFADARGHENRLVAVCDPDPDRRAGRSGPRGNLEAADPGARFLDPAKVRAYRTPDELLADAEVELVSICSWTETHVPLAIAALQAGKHVLVEKPLALDSDAVAPLAAAVLAARTLCMPAMCMRFWPGWRWLAEAIAEAGPRSVRRAAFSRRGTHPGPLHPFYGDESRCGGAHFDVHVHDADFILWVFGPPVAVTARGSLGSVSTTYEYAAGPREVVADAGWDLPAGQPFRMRFEVELERMTADFDIQRADRLMFQMRPATLAPTGSMPPTAAMAVPVPEGSGYDHEVCAMLHAIARGARNADLPVTVADGHAVLRLLEAERDSFRTGRRIEL